MWYRADFEDDNFELILANNDSHAIEEAEKYEEEHGIVFNIFEINKNYDNVRTVF